MTLVLGGCGRAGLGPAKAPAATTRAGGKVVVELVRRGEPGEVVRFRSGVAEAGPAAGPFALRAYAGTALADDLWYFRRTFSRFRHRAGATEVRLWGEGTLPAGPVERRLLLEWARAAVVELEGGGVERSFGLVFSWHGDGGTAPCDGVSVFASGTVWAEPCPWSGAVHARLDPVALARLYAWFDNLTPFQVAPGQGGAGGASERAPRLIFAGTGKRAANAAERAEVEAFGGQLSRELQARRRLPPGVAPAEPVLTALLLPAELAQGGKPIPRTLELPAEAPLPPAPAPSPF